MLVFKSVEELVMNVKQKKTRQQDARSVSTCSVMIMVLVAFLVAFLVASSVAFSVAFLVTFSVVFLADCNCSQTTLTNW